jgi:hypothetical protein
LNFKFCADHVAKCLSEWVGHWRSLQEKLGVTSVMLSIPSVNRIFCALGTITLATQKSFSHHISRDAGMLSLSGRMMRFQEDPRTGNAVPVPPLHGDGALIRGDRRNQTPLSECRTCAGRRYGVRSVKDWPDYHLKRL